MIENIYNFFFEWLFSSQIPAFISAQGVEFICLVFTITTFLAVLSLALIPFKAFFRFIF